MDERIIFQIIQQVLLVGTNIEFTPHAVKRMIERKIASSDVLDILKNPNYIQKEVESSEYSGKYNYRVMGKNDWSVVVSVYYGKNQLVVVTVID